MVAGKVKAAIGFQKSPITPKTDRPRRSSTSPSTNSSSKATSVVFSRSFGVYFPRSSAQVQPKPPDVADLLHLIEKLQEKESRLQSQLLEQKILKETVALVPFLEKELTSRTEQLDRAKKTMDALEEENGALRSKIQEREEKMKEMSAENEELRRRRTSTVADIDDCSSIQRFQGLIDASAKSNLLKSLRKVPKPSDIAQTPQVPKPNAGAEKKEEISSEVFEMSKPKAPRIPKPPPLPSTSHKSTSSVSSSSSSSESTASSNEAAPVGRLLPPPPPPPPPPPAAKGMKSATATVRKVPEVVEFYHSLMRRDSKRESGSGVTDATSAANARNMIGEIENRSAHLLAIKTDVETQGEFIRFLIKEVQNAAFTNIEDLVAFVKWLDDELSYLVDERAVLKHFDWPEQKADAMREAAFGYCDLKKLESEASSFRDDDGRQQCSSALKKMQALLEKLEHGLYDLSRVREGAAKRYKGFQIPWEWMMDTGFVIKIKLASVKLAMKYVKRVSSELETVAGGPEEEELMLQGVRFAFRVHQFAGGFDVETMRAFQELRDKARSLQCQKQSQQQQQKLISMSC